MCNSHDFIPHKDPESDEDFVYLVHYPKEHGLTFDDFHPAPKDTKLSQQAIFTLRPHWQVVAEKIRDFHARFAAHNTRFKNPRCSAPDRFIVLCLYREALGKLEHASDLDAKKINFEVITKVHTVLDLRIAEPKDAVFYTKDAFLQPLEPQYAHPRLDFYDRGPEHRADSYFWTGFGRLMEWRREGWPGNVPVRAIEKERKQRERRRRKGKELLRETTSEGLLEALKDDLIWGEELDADPGRPWA